MVAVLIFVAVFAAVTLGGWVLHAIAHPVAAGRGALILACRAAGVVALITAIVASVLGQGLLQAVPGAVLMAAFFIAANRLERRWRRS